MFTDAIKYQTSSKEIVNPTAVPATKHETVDVVLALISQFPNSTIYWYYKKITSYVRHYVILF